MMDKKYSKKKLTRQQGMLAAVSILLIVLLVAAACGAAATATPEPTAAPEPTAVPDEPTAVPDEPTAMPDTGLRPRSEWTEEEPVTFEELEAEIEKHRGESFVFTSWGGAYQAAQRQAYIEPYEQQFGIDVVEESPTEYPVIRAMVETGNYKWNVIDVGGRALWAEIKIGSLEELDKSVVDTSNHVDSVRNHPNPTYGGGGGITWSTVLAYNTDSYPEGSITTWADYFDRENFPGRRSVRDAYRASWFVALSVLHPEWYDDDELKKRLGAPTEEDVQDALAFWEENPPDHFWHTGSDCPQLLISGEVDICTAWNGRIYDAQQQEDAPLAICWECGHLIGTGAFVMAKGLKEAEPLAFENGQLFIAWTGQPQINAQQSKYISYGPLNLKSIPYLSEPEFDEVRPALPLSEANVPYGVIENERYSGEYNDQWAELWLGFLQSVDS